MAYFKKVTQEYRKFRANIIDNRRVKQQPVEVHRSQFLAFIQQFQLSLGYGQIFRLPTAVYRNKGGTFFWAYAISLLLISNGMSCMEKYIGQYCSKSPIGAFAMVPAAKGIGYSLFIQGFFLMAYYTQITSIAIYFFLKSFSLDLPWSTCYIKYDQEDDIYCVEQNETCPDGKKCDFPGNFHWHYVAKQPFRPFHPNYGYLGRLQMDLVLCSMAAWVVVSICMSYKPKSKFMYFSIIATLAMFLIMLTASMQDEKATLGVTKFYSPIFSQFLDFPLWRGALQESMYVAGTGMITSVTFGTASHFTSLIHIDCAVISFLNIFISCVSGSIVFAVIGEKTLQRDMDFFGAPISSLALTFIIYPMALQKLPYPSLFSIFFFFLFIDLGVTHSAAFGRSIALCVNEIWPSSCQYQVLVNSCIALIGFIIGLPILCRGGSFYFDVLDRVGVGLTIVFMCAIEALVVTQSYGLGLFCEDIVFMTNRYPRRFYRYIWGSGGFILLIIFIADFFYYPPEETWKPWTIYLGVGFVVIFLSPIFLIGLYVVIKTRKNAGNWSSLYPNPDYGPGTRYLRAKRKEFTIPWRIF